MTFFPRLLRQIPNLPLASCKDIEDKDFFFASDHELADRIEELRNFCGSCPEVAKCLRHALDNNEHHGFWGGKTAKERRAILRKRPSAKSKQSKVDERGAQIHEFREKGATYQEIANHLGITEASAIQTVVRYRKKLKEAM